MSTVAGTTPDRTQYRPGETVLTGQARPAGQAGWAGRAGRASRAGWASRAGRAGRAGHGDAGSFDALYRQHQDLAWGLAQATAPDAEAAAAAVRCGFARAAGGRRSARRQDAFGLSVLTAVYRFALAQTRPGLRPATRPRPRPPLAAGPEAAQTDASFRRLPERWRAAVWLRDVEGFDGQQTAGVLGVSVPIAEQLVVRGRRSLAGELPQPAMDHPEGPTLGELLRRGALPVPAGLIEHTAAEWSHRAATRPSLRDPLASWVQDHRGGPLAMALGTVVGLGLIALGVLSGGAAVRNLLGGNGTDHGPGSIPVGTCPGPTCPAAYRGPAGPFGGALLTTFLPPLAGGGTPGGFPAGALGGVAAGGGGTAPTSGGGSSVGGGTDGGSAPGSGGGSTGTGGGTGSTGSGLPPTATLTVPGVGAVSTRPSGLLGTPTLGISTPSVGTVTINCNGTLIQTTSCPPPSNPPTTPPPAGAAVGALGNDVAGTTTTVPVVGGIRAAPPGR